MSIIMHVFSYQSVEHALCRDGKEFCDCAQTLTQVKLQLPICVPSCFGVVPCDT